MKLPLPNFKKMRKILAGRPPRPRRLDATARRAAPMALEEYDDSEPTTRISTALIVVLILHVVALGGVYAFSQVRRTQQADEAVMLANKAPAQKPAAMDDTTPPAPAPAPALIASAPPAATMPISGSKIYHVKSGDTFTKIANLYGIGANDLATANGLKETSMLRVGQILNIPPSKTVAKSTPADTTHKPEVKKADETAARPSPSGTAKTYTVKKGDNPVNIAKNQNVSYDELLKLNKIEDPKKLQIGAVLKLPPSKKSKPDPDHS